ncbi:NAD(P)/FAD-dependent oxidoreductase [Asanoa iriomotensis]|uniref:Ferredoxin n=1 Tax=Asanoa iriomotensis TaxID=234613 RepID=A0ABQ4C3N4_9ACTN|nr:FAD-dependent oxidoreductase [Asanoa iriomotensis]GIF57391.1 ferredoxin [Asanoa iriomotensis]
MGTLIVGAGQAGVQVAASLRENGYTAPITLLGAEPHPPYERPPLSKQFAGPLDIERLRLRAPSFYADADIDLVTSQRVTHVRLPDGTGRTGVATTEAGLRVGFDTLVLAVGGRPRALAVPGVDLAGVGYLRGLDEAVRLREQAAGVARVVVVGGGFVGLEVAAGLRKLGKDVTVVETADRLLARAVAPVVSEFYRAAHERRGVRVVLGARVTAFTGAGSVTGVRLADGRVIPADLVLVGIGMEPRTELATTLGLACAGGGVLVDAQGRTSHPAVYAVGDCTAFPNADGGYVRVESVQNALAKARATARAIAGREPQPEPVPWFWSDQDDIKLQIAGIGTGYDTLIVRGDPERERFSVLYLGGGELLAVDAVNSPRDYLVVRKALATRTTVDPTLAADADVDLRRALGSFTASAAR